MAANIITPEDLQSFKKELIEELMDIPLYSTPRFRSKGRQ